MNSNISEINLKKKCQKSQLNLLNDRESKHDKLDETPIVISFVLSGIEAGAAFFLLLPGGVLIAAIGAICPVALLWAMANYQSDRVDLINKYDELSEEYHDAI